MEIKTITRTSAIVYAESMEQRKTDTIRRKFVEAIWIENGNTPLTLHEVEMALYDTLELQFDDNDLRSIIINDPTFVEQKAKSDDDTKYLLKEDRYRLLSNKSGKNIEKVIDRYIDTFHDDNSISRDGLREILEKYLYALLNSNIAAYSQVLSSSPVKNNKGVINSDFDEEQIKIINHFISWRDDEKNKELYKLVSYCVEYAIVVNNSSENAFIESIRNKRFYLDNSLIYRAIGINGDYRRKRTLSFIRKCHENGNKLFVSKYSEEEFRETIDFHLKQLGNTTPYGRINPEVFKRYADGEGFYQFYHKWREKKMSYGFELFRSHIISDYNTLLKTYGIEEDFTVPFDEKESREVEQYEEQIKQLKNKGHDSLHHNDACNMYWIECKRAGNDAKITDTKYYFITTDQKLQKWDYSHSKNQPITLLPSQWMALLLKYVSRTNDDYKSFVSFLKLPHNDPVISADELQTVMAGISEITENFKSQVDIVDVLFESDWRDILKDTPRVAAKEFAKERLESQLLAQLQEKENQHESSMREINKAFDDKMARLKEEAGERLLRQELQFKQDRLSDAERKIRDMKIMKRRADESIEGELNRLKWKMVISILLAVIVYACVVFWIGWNTMEIYTWLVGLGSVAVGAVYLIRYEKKFSLERTLKKYRDKYTNHYYSLFMYSEEGYQDLTDAREELMSQIETIESELNIRD